MNKLEEKNYNSLNIMYNYIPQKIDLRLLYHSEIIKKHIRSAHYLQLSFQEIKSQFSSENS